VPHVVPITTKKNPANAGFFLAITLFQNIRFDQQFLGKRIKFDHVQVHGAVVDTYHVSHNHHAID
jgi:hypothetical protein